MDQLSFFWSPAPLAAQILSSGEFFWVSPAQTKLLKFYLYYYYMFYNLTA